MEEKISSPATADVSTRRAWTSAVVVIFCVLIIDQVLKVFVKTHFALHEELFVTGWFRLLFVENRGMAFGMDFVGTMFLTLFRLVAIGLFLWLLSSAIRRHLPAGLRLCLALIIAGAAGNIVDNCFYGLMFSESTPWQVATTVPFGEGYGAFLEGKVVDMFYFPLFTWPDWVPLLGGQVFFNAIFNFADAAISCGAIALLLFYPKYVLASKPKSEATSSDEPAGE